MRMLNYTTCVSFLIFLILIVLEMNGSNIWVHGQCLKDQKTLLLQLNKSLISSSHMLPSDIKASSKRSSWSSNTDCCKSWGGVGCDRSGHITSLDLSDEFIYGELNSTSSLFKLQYLESLNLAFNNFILTPIPSGFGRLVNLTYLNLSNSGFSGKIPIEISHMRRLVTLDLSTFQPGSYSFTLKNPDLRTLTQNLKEPRVLSLDGVNISAHGSKWCNAVSSSLPKLQVLSLSNCYLSGPFDSSLLQLSLYELRLNQNNISAEVPEFFIEFLNLTSLHLSSCGLNGKFPEKVLQLKTLRNLYLSDNKLLQGSLPEFSKDELLRNLVLSDTSFAGELPHSIGNLTLLSRLELDNCSFNGSIPPSISNLNQLQYLDLSMNNYTGSIPSIGWSKSLTDIDLSYNQFTGPIPSEWNKLPKLVNLNLKKNSFNTMNQFTGGLDEFPSGSSSSLEHLDMSINKLEGPIPESIFDLFRLKILTLSSNNFNGTLSLEKFFHKFENLSSLDLSGNKLSITFVTDNFTLFPEIHILMLRSCNLSVFPAFLSNQSRLEYLDVSENQIKGKIPNWIHLIGEGYLGYLNDEGYFGYLNLSYNFLEDPQLPSPPNSFKKLSTLDLRSNRLQGKNVILPPFASILDYSLNNFTSMIPNISSYLSVAIYLSLSNNQLTGEIPKSVCEAGYLQVLDLSHNNLSGEIPPCLGSIPNLGVLNLRGNNLDGIIPDVFPKICTLETLDLHGNQFKGHLPRSLANCAMLEVLDLGNNQLTGDFPSRLGSMSNLRVLVLRSNRFHGPLGNAIGLGLQKLQIVDISSNKFTGTLCRKCFSGWTGMMVNVDETQSNHQILGFRFLQLSDKVLDIELVKFFTTFAFIDFSNNEFEGEIPEVIGNLSSLYALNLSRNSFSGTIPSSIGNLARLESLDLSQNKLTGEIPLELTELTFLSVLNLSFNELEGKIPWGTQFQTFEVNSFEGNDGLCGAPISNSCTITESSPQNGWKSDDELHEFDWVLLMVSFLGFLVGASMIIGPQYFWKEGREWANEHMNNILNIT
ncbi:hypothetical protein MKX03_036254 [Papaver bracteatum]|nr:hypothetical protein MKX03_036254 [Papaver bracteatum]